MPRDIELALEVDRILEERPSQLTEWLTEQELTYDDVYCGPWGGLVSTLKKRGLLDAGQRWMAEQADRIWQHYGATEHRRVAKAITRRFVVARMDREEPAPNVLHETRELDILPDHLRWVVLHPGLAAVEGSELASESAARAYEEKNHAPNQAAVNLYHHCKSDKASRQKMFDEVGRVLLEERKRKAAAKEAAKGEADPETQAICDLEEELGVMMKAD